MPLVPPKDLASRFPPYKLPVREPRDEDNVFQGLELSELLTVTFHRSQRVPDNEDVRIQKVARGMQHSSFPCHVVKMDKPESEDKQYYLALNTLESFAIRVAVKKSMGIAAKLKVRIAGVNVAAPTRDLGQDYFFADSRLDALWIDGFAVKREPRRVRQFVAIDPGTGHSFQNQLQGRVPLGEEIEISVTLGQKKADEEDERQVPLRPDVYARRRRSSLVRMADQPGENTFHITVKDLMAKTHEFLGMSSDLTVADVIDCVEYKFGTPATQQRLIYQGKFLELDKTLGECGITEGAVLLLVLRFRGGGLSGLSELRVAGVTKDMARAMEVAPGGLISQPIAPDPGTYRWGQELASTLKIKIVDLFDFEKLTGRPPPALPALPNVNFQFEGYSDLSPEEQRIESLPQHHKTHPSDLEFTVPRRPDGKGKPVDERPEERPEEKPEEKKVVDGESPSPPPPEAKQSFGRRFLERFSSRCRPKRQGHGK